MNFRVLRFEDKGQLVELLKQLSPTFDASDFALLALIKSKSFFGFVVENNNKIAGFGSLIVYPTILNGIVGRIEDVVVDQEYRGQGIGRKIMQMLIRQAFNCEVDKINLTSNPKREAARRLYQSLGFKKVETGLFALELTPEYRKQLHDNG